MDSKDIINIGKKNEKLKIIKSKNQFINIKSDYFIQKLFANMQKRISLKIIKCNINIQKRLNININNYKDFSEKFSSIELEIIPIQNEYGPFIKIKDENKKYFHIYFNNNKEEIKRTELNKEDKVSKINITIDYQIESFCGLFDGCKCIESINFKKFFRNNVTDMGCMFCGCSSLKELNLSNFNNNSLTDMEGMFLGYTDEFQMKIKSQYKNINKEEFV
jgi:surface protein